MTKTVNRDEVGKVFSALALIAACTPMVVNSIIKKVYVATLEIFPSAYLVMAACFYALAVALNYTLFFARKEIDDTNKEEEEEVEQ